MYRILIVDDEPLTLEYLAGLLPRFFAEGELQLAEAENGSSALKQLQEREMDIVISDIRMPVMDGLQLARTLHEEYPDSFILLLSGYEEFTYAHEAIRYGVSDYLLKPIVPQELEASLKKLCAAVNRRRAEQRVYHSIRSEISEAAREELSRLTEGRTGARPHEESRTVAIGKNYIASHYKEPVSLALIAEKAGVTESYFSTLFHKEVGESYIHYLTRIRMEEAARLLRESSSKIYEVAEAVGYISVRHFNHTFKQWYGMTPNDYQQSTLR